LNPAGSKKETIMGLTNFPNGITSFGVPVLGGIGGLPFTGNWWFVDPVNGLDGNAGTSPSQALQSLYQAVNKAGNGTNDVIVLMSNGSTTGSSRLSLAAAQAINSAVTAGTLLWNKNALHLIGVTAPAFAAQYARIAPPTGTYAQSTFGSGNFVVVTGNGCIFANVSLFHGFSTGGTNQICWTDNGQRNAYYNMHFGGMGDTVSAQDAGSRSFKLGTSGNGEMSFDSCTFGLDTVQRGTSTTVNATLELAGGTPRNRFNKCSFLMDAATAYPVHVLGTGASCVDREQIFQDCSFLNSIKSAGTGINEVLSFTNASPGGYVLFKSCTTVGATKWGDTNGLANSYVDGGAPTNSSTGLAVNPS
jgi:hypothetical protein